jgi:DNA-binding MarR family transcriptional regulator
MMPARQDASGIFTGLVLETFRFNGRLLAAGDALTADLGLSSARWQVLGALQLAGRPLTVPQIARNMGLTRQGVQRLADLLADRGLMEFVDNPEHQRAKLLRLTARGRAALERIDRRQRRWAARMVRGLDRRALRGAYLVLRRLRERLEEEGDGASHSAVEERANAQAG